MWGGEGDDSKVQQGKAMVKEWCIHGDGLADVPL